MQYFLIVLGYILIGLIVLAVGHAFASCRAWTFYPTEDYLKNSRSSLVGEWMFLVVPSAVFWPVAIILAPLVFGVRWLFKLSASAGKACALKKRNNQSCKL